MIEQTTTDKSFDDANPGYYTFGAKEISGKCVKCGRKFKTHLSCARFCSREHQLAFMGELTTTHQSPRHFSGSERKA